MEKTPNKRNKTGPDPVVFSQVYQKLQERVEKNWQSGENLPLPSELKLCEEYHCSRVTVRRVLSVLESEGRVLRLAGKGTFPLSPDQGAARVQPHVVWLLSFDFFKGETLSSYVKDFLTCLRYHAGNKTENVTIDMNLDQTMPFEPKKFAVWARMHKADVVITRADSLDQQKLPALKQTGIPIVLWGRRSQSPDIDSVSVDYYGDVERAVNLLVDLGHRNIAYVGAEGSDEPTLARNQAFRDCLTKYHLSSCGTLCPTYNYRDIYEHTLKILAEGKNRPSAILTSGLSCNWPCLQALTSTRLQVPQEISVMAIDDFAQAPFYCPPVSVIRQPYSLLVEQAIDVARRRVLNPKAPVQNVLLKSEIILRESLARYIPS